MTRALAFTVTLALWLGCSDAFAGIIRGYVLDKQGHRVPGARVEAWRMVLTDQQPPQHPTKLGKATADSHGEFTLTVARLSESVVLIASFDRQSGTAAPSFDHVVRIALRPRPVH
jgi:hypothetical protein